MRIIKSNLSLAVFFGFLVNYTTLTFATTPLPEQLIDFLSPSGTMLFKENLNPNALKLLSNFTTQKTMTYCGIASAVIVLNSSGLKPPVDSNHSPYHYFNQEDFFNDQVKKIITPEEVQKNGISLRNLAKVLQSYQLKVDLFYADDIDEDKFRVLLKNAISNQQFIIINFSRKPLHQAGNGHHSPIAAYDEKTDRFLLLDVARFKCPPFWVKTHDLWNAVNTLDDDTYRGFLIISR